MSDVTWVDATSEIHPNGIDQTYCGRPLAIHGQSYQKELWFYANASATYYLGGNCTRLTANPLQVRPG
ncbi:NPCBM/NEW2 domain-containing protein [Nocardia sp. NPDC059239]|uniref:NPCBM/NEW2 domain-containing protein n=1 Tax=Nocardia sp. NPDC059239 TaxID=3346785 RepID=UPI0036BC6E72